MHGHINSSWQCPTHESVSFSTSPNFPEELLLILHNNTSRKQQQLNKGDASCLHTATSNLLCFHFLTSMDTSALAGSVQLMNLRFFYILLPQTSLKNYFLSSITTPAGNNNNSTRAMLPVYILLPQTSLLPFPHLHGHICSSWQCPTHELVFFYILLPRTSLKNYFLSSITTPAGNNNNSTTAMLPV